MNAEIPKGLKGKKKTTGYPDILFWYNNNPYYLECETYNNKNISTTQRSFYFSPSEDFKVLHDALHFIFSYEIYIAGVQGNKQCYKCKHYKIISLETLATDLKYEFNSDNKRLYSDKDGAKMLFESDI